MNRLQQIGCVLVALCLLAASRTWAGDDVGSFFVFDDLTFGGTTINFDTDAAGNPIAAPCLFSDAETLTELYAPLGVHFAAASGVDGGAILNDCSAFQLKAHSGANLLAFNRTAATASGGRATEPETITFDTPMPNVSIYAAGGFAPQTFRLDAYDAHGRLVDSSSASTQDWAPLSVKSDAGITRVVLSRDSGARKARVFTPDVAGAPGDTISIPVQIDDAGRDVAGASVTLQFDDALSVTDPSQVTLGSLLAGGLLATNIMMPGSVTVAATGSQGQDGPGALLIVTATIPAGAMLGTHPLMLSRVQLNDSMGNPIPVDAMSGTFTVRPMPVMNTGQVFIGDVPAAPGGQVTIPIQADGNVHGLAGVHLVLQFGAALQVADAGQVALGPVLAGPTGTVAVNLSTPGQVTIGAINTQAQNGPGVLATVTGTVPPGTAPGTYPLTLSTVDLNDLAGKPIPAAAVSGTLTVSGMQLCGDLNGNGRLDVADATLALRIGVGLLMPSDAQTVAGCGNPLNVAFATRLLRAAIGLSAPPTPRM